MLFHHVVRRKRLQPQARQDTILAEVNEMLILPFGSHLYLGQGSEKDGELALDEITMKMSDQGKVEAIRPLISRTMELSHHSIRDYQLVVPRQLML